ncbi:helix-turn-helix domain-containing protein [Actinomadura rubrisoli]|uniref:XRE family transcriptional regulator n=1 Tax=Actinomadura rubrisoli TaxID=2530368 RepID=A0A4R5B6B5_9ACTN|nr:helix-turn-helix transcriptional regulator [Actinomadura rubrisoli]TDD80170.1 XRE family transcriptional regulator [Actinomadura rubrisoli]
MQADPFWRSAVVTALVDAGDLGEVIRLARQHRGWRQADLGRATSYSAATISRLEKGRTAGLDVLKAKKIATVLEMPANVLAVLLGVAGPAGSTVVTRVAPVVQEDPMRRRNLLAAGLAAVPAAALARLDDALALTPAAAVPATRAQVAARLWRAWRLFDSGNLREMVDGLPALLADVHRTAAEEADEPATWVLVAAVYDLAAEALHKVGAAPQSRITADRAMTYAARSEDPVAQAAAARSLGIVLRHEGHEAVAQRLTMQAVARLDRTGLTTPTQIAAYAQTLCTTAYNASLADDRDSALEMMAEARRAARGLPTQMPARPTTAHRFKITLPQVALYEVGVRWGLGDAGAALTAGRDLRPEQFATAERRARLHTDMARAYVQRGRPEPAIARLLDAYQQAPSEVRDRLSIRRVAVGLVERHRRVPGARELAAIL